MSIVQVDVAIYWLHPPAERVDPIILRDDAAVFVWLVASERDEEAACRVLQDNYRESTLSVPVRFKGLQLKVVSWYN